MSLCYVSRITHMVGTERFASNLSLGQRKLWPPLGIIGQALKRLKKAEAEFRFGSASPGCEKHPRNELNEFLPDRG